MHLNIQALKLAPLLAQYLYSNRRLDLPGIGTFLLDPSTVIEMEPGKQKNQVIEGISFESNPAAGESPDLIAYISTHTGKMKPLASADFYSHMELMQQFLNIGKPFVLEGIGSLVKIRSGEYAFRPGLPIVEKMTGSSSRFARDATAETTAKNDTYDPLLGQDRSGTVKWRKPVSLLLLLAGIGAAIWGGYRVYQNRVQQSHETLADSAAAPDRTILVNDTSTIPPVHDSIHVNTSTVTQPPRGTYKFVLETAPAKRALERFAKLKSYQWDVKMETKDSILYKLFILLPASDTSRVLDSLSTLNGRRVYIE